MNLPTATEIVQSIQRKERSVESVVIACLEQIEAQEPEIRAFVEVDEHAALAEARQRDRQASRGPLHGVPVAVKEVVDTAGLHCGWGSEVYKDRVPQSDAGVVRKLREAGAVIIGTTVSTEYAIGAAGPTRNPVDRTRTPGGSSSGSAAAVGAGLVPIAIGSQTIGSIIRPATYCGVFGIKPTKDVVSTEGTMIMSEHLDHIGPMAANPADLALACQAIYEPGPALDALGQVKDIPANLKLLLVEGPARHRMQPETTEALARAAAGFSDLGYKVQTLSLPSDFDACQSIIETILYKDLWTHYQEDYHHHVKLMSPRMQGILEEGAKINADAYQHALCQAAGMRDTARSLMKDAVVLSPAADGVPPLSSDGTGANAQQALWTLLGFPALALPCGCVDGLPVGVQLSGLPGTDALLLKLADGFSGAVADRNRQGDS